MIKVCSCRVEVHSLHLLGQDMTLTLPIYLPAIYSSNIEIRTSILIYLKSLRISAVDMLGDVWGLSWLKVDVKWGLDGGRDFESV